MTASDLDRLRIRLYLQLFVKQNSVERRAAFVKWPRSLFIQFKQINCVRFKNIVIGLSLNIIFSFCFCTLYFLNIFTLIVVNET